MIKKIITNIENNNCYLNDIEYLLGLKEASELKLFFEKSRSIQRKFFIKTDYESNIYYPSIYKIEDNCPTCGYRSNISRQKYTEEFIIKSIKYKLKDICDYPISGINCYNKDITGIRELLIILNTLEKYDLKISTKVSNPKYLNEMKKFNVKSIIFQSSLNKLVKYTERYHEEKVTEERKLLKRIKQKMNMEITYEFLIGYGESYHDIFNKICEINRYDIDSIEIKGYDPFIDTPEEYNPQYTNDYILKIISLLRIYFPNIELKIQHATNNNENLREYMDLGINTVTGIYTPHMNSKLKYW